MPFDPQAKLRGKSGRSNGGPLAPLPVALQRQRCGWHFGGIARYRSGHVNVNLASAIHQAKTHDFSRVVSPQGVNQYNGESAGIRSLRSDITFFSQKKARQFPFWSQDLPTTRVLLLMPAIAQWYLAAPSGVAKYIMPLSNFSSAPALVGTRGSNLWALTIWAAMWPSAAATNRAAAPAAHWAEYNSNSSEYFEPGGQPPFPPQRGFRFSLRTQHRRIARRTRQWFSSPARVLFLHNSETLGDMQFIGYVIQSGLAVICPVYKGTYEPTASLALASLGRSSADGHG